MIRQVIPSLIVQPYSETETSGGPSWPAVVHSNICMWACLMCGGGGWNSSPAVTRCASVSPTHENIDCSRLRYSADKNCSKTTKHPHSPARQTTLASLAPSEFSALESYPCGKGKELCRRQWMLGLQASVSKRCPSSMCMWHWRLG